MLDPITRSVRKYAPSRNNSKENLDRFIPNRSATKFDYVLEERWRHKASSEFESPTKQAYQQKLRKVFNLENSRIFAYKNKPPTPVTLYPEDDYSVVQPFKPVRPRQRNIPQTADKTLDAPRLLDDYYVNLLDWSSNNVLAIALGNTVYLWNANTCSVSELFTVDEDTGPVTSVSWVSDGCHIAVGFHNSHVQLWDATTNKLVRTLREGHQARVGSLAWNRHILTSGSMDCSIINNDVRVRGHIVETYQGHRGQICGLKWSQSGQKLASGGNDNLVYIWDQSLTPARTQWLHRFQDHRAAVRALAWCPFQSNMLASGGGGADGCIKFWNTDTGACLNSVNTGSQVCSLLWSKTDRELLSSHGSPQNQLTLWKYPSMTKMAEPSGHQSRVLFTTQSPDGCTVASAAGADDETLRFWKVFGEPEKTKPADKRAPEPFAHFSRIR
ncbi:hypothetical protein KSS87_008884 [Heliosperma pusillum]|nr:hypothetical protein KSS87_008884 [Heliosperma pusillum]